VSKWQVEEFAAQLNVGGIGHVVEAGASDQFAGVTNGDGTERRRLVERLGFKVITPGGVTDWSVGGHGVRYQRDDGLANACLAHFSGSECLDRNPQPYSGTVTVRQLFLR